MTAALFLLDFRTGAAHKGERRYGAPSETRRWAVEKDIFSEHVQVERKTFSFELKENPRGRFLRITEDVGGRRDMVIVPSTGLEEVRAVLDRAISAHKAAGPVEPTEPAGAR